MSNKFAVLALLSFTIVTLGFAANQSANAIGSGNGTVTNGTLTYPPNVTNASSTVIIAANSAVIQRVGSAYFNNYINLAFAQTYTYRNGTNISYVSYSYSIPFINGTTTRGTIQYGGLLALLHVAVSLNRNIAAGYTGPSGPYYIRVSPQNATAAAKAYGLTNLAAPYITAAYSSQTSSRANGYQLAWAVLSNGYIYPKPNCTYGCRLHPGAYVNTTTGKVEGEFTVNPAILTASGGAAAPGVLGNFSAYSAQSSSSIVPPSSSSNNLLLQNLAPRLIILGIVIVVVMFLIRTTPRAKRARR